MYLIFYNINDDDFFYKIDNTINPYTSSINQNSNCSGPSTTSTVGQWNNTYAYGSYQNYLTSIIPSAQLSTSNVSVTYTPYVIFFPI